MASDHSRAVSGKGKKVTSLSAPEASGEQQWVFDRAAFERDSRIIRAIARWPLSAAVFLIGIAVVFLGLHLMDEFDRRGDRPWQKITAPAKLPARPPANRSTAGPKHSIPPQVATVKQMRDRLIKGDLDREAMEQFREFPDYERCQHCLGQCDAKAENKASWKAQECRRNCLRTCSDYGSKLLDL